MRWGGGSWVDLLDSFIVVFIAFPSKMKSYGFDASSRPPTLNISYNSVLAYSGDSIKCYAKTKRNCSVRPHSLITNVQILC